MVHSVTNGQKAIFSKQILKILVHHWEEASKSKYFTENAQILFQTFLKNQSTFQVFQEWAQTLMTELEPYQEVLREIQFHPRIGSIVLITFKENYLNLPLDFFRFRVILGDKKAKQLLNWLKAYINQTKKHNLEYVIARLNKELYEGKIRLTKTDLAILRELSKSPKTYFLPDHSVSSRSSFLAKRIRPHFISINRSLQKMTQLGILKYNAYINYPMLGLTPYLAKYASSPKFHPLEEEFIPLKITSSCGDTFAIILIPTEREDRIAQQINLTPLTRFQTFWNFTTYTSKEICFPEKLRGDIDHLDDFIIPQPLGVTIDYLDGRKVKFNTLDLRIIHEFSCGWVNQDITEYFKEINVKKRSYTLKSHVWKKTKFFLDQKIVFPYFYVTFVGVHSQCFIFAKGQNKQISQLEKLLRPMINATHYFGADRDGQIILFSRVRMPPAWQHSFHTLMNQLQKLDFSVLQFGWYPWAGTSRRIYLSQLWNEEEEYWNFPYHLRTAKPFVSHVN
ncbi:MAG: hypothetical protein ACFFBD_05920 [Candidatus Hodarchaeota archaeon]